MVFSSDLTKKSKKLCLITGVVRRMNTNIYFLFSYLHKWASICYKNRNLNLNLLSAEFFESERQIVNMYIDECCKKSLHDKQKQTTY